MSIHIATSYIYMPKYPNTNTYTNTCTYFIFQKSRKRGLYISEKSKCLLKAQSLN